MLCVTGCYNTTLLLYQVSNSSKNKTGRQYGATSGSLFQRANTKWDQPFYVMEGQ
jgi:hypothetical protein